MTHTPPPKRSRLVEVVRGVAQRAPARAAKARADAAEVAERLAREGSPQVEKALKALHPPLTKKAASRARSLEREKRRQCREAEVARMSREGVPVRQIASRLGLSEKTVVRLRRNLRCGAVLKKKRGDNHLAEVRRLSSAGHSVSKIAKELNLSYYYVVQLRGAAGVSRARRRK